MRARGCRPGLGAHNAALTACAKVGEWEKALSLLDVMETRGVDPDVCSYTSAIAACGRAGEVAHAWSSGGGRGR